MKTKSGMNCRLEGTICILSVKASDGKKKHPADGAKVKIVTNRRSGILVEMVQSHGIYSKGAQLQVAPHECISEESIKTLEKTLKEVFSVN